MTKVSSGSTSMEQQSPMNMRNIGQTTGLQLVWSVELPIPLAIAFGNVPIRLSCVQPSHQMFTKSWHSFPAFHWNMDGLCDLHWLPLGINTCLACLVNRFSSPMCLNCPFWICSQMFHASTLPTETYAWLAGQLFKHRPLVCPMPVEVLSQLQHSHCPACYSLRTVPNLQQFLQPWNMPSKLMPTFAFGLTVRACWRSTGSSLLKVDPLNPMANTVTFSISLRVLVSRLGEDKIALLKVPAHESRLDFENDLDRWVACRWKQCSWHRSPSRQSPSSCRSVEPVVSLCWSSFSFS